MSKQYTGCEALALAAAKPEEVVFKGNEGIAVRVSSHGIPQQKYGAGWQNEDHAFAEWGGPFTLVGAEKSGEQLLTEIHASWSQTMIYAHAAAIRKIVAEELEKKR